MMDKPTMTAHERMERIKELKTELKLLENSERRYACPNLYAQPFREKFGYMDEILRPLTARIRLACFGGTIQQRTPKGRTVALNVAVALKPCDLTDAQYTKYCEYMQRIYDALNSIAEEVPDACQHF